MWLRVLILFAGLCFFPLKSFAVSCTVNAVSSVNFSAVNPIANTDATTSMTFNYTCTKVLIVDTLAGRQTRMRVFGDFHSMICAVNKNFVFLVSALGAVALDVPLTLAFDGHIRCKCHGFLLVNTKMLTMIIPCPICRQATT